MVGIISDEAVLAVRRLFLVDDDKALFFRWAEGCGTVPAIQGMAPEPLPFGHPKELAAKAAMRRHARPLTASLGD